MNSTMQPQEDVLPRIIRACEALSEEYSATLDASCVLGSPLSFSERRAHAVADAAVSWCMTCLERQLKDFQREAWTSELLLVTITDRVCELVSFYEWHLGQSTNGKRSAELRSHADCVYPLFQDAQHRVSTLVLAPALAHLVLSDECINIGWQLCLDGMPNEKGERQAEIALVIERLFQQKRLDERYAALARGLASLTGPGRSPSDFGGATGAVRRLHTEEFLTYIAQLFAESFAAYKAWLIDSIAVAYAAMRLQQKKRA